MRFEKILVGMGLGDIKAYPPKSDADDLNEAEILWLKQFEACGLSWEVLMRVELEEALEVMRMGSPELATLVRAVFVIVHEHRA
jgi:hypothetical protein